MFDFLKKKKPADDLKLPPLPELPDFPEEIPSLKDLENEAAKRSEGLDMPPMPPPSLEMPIIMPKFEEKPKDVAPEIPRVAKQKKSDVYIRVDTFKALLDNLARIREDLRQYQRNIEEFEETRKEEEKLFDRWQKSVHDAQRRVISVEKTLYSRG